MDGLVEWLREQLDEDERTARAASAPVVGQEPQAVWTARRHPTEGMGGPQQAAVEARFELVASSPNPWDINVAMAQVTHMAEHDPARVLREIDAKRRIVNECDWGGPDHADVYEAVLQRLALPYADRPGYREEWRP